jgi:hypothetical protein
MDEIKLFTAIRPEARGFADGDRRAARQRLLAAADPQACVRPRTLHLPASATSGLRWIRPAWMFPRHGVAATAVLAAAAAAAVVTAALPGARSGLVPPAQAGSPARLHAPAGPGGFRPSGPASPPTSAQQVLLLAARAAATTPTLTPGPHQYIYTELLGAGEEVAEFTGQGKEQLRKHPPYASRNWLSADGQHTVNYARNLPDGKWSIYFGPFTCRKNCSPGYVTDLPRTVRGMRGFLLSYEGHDGPAAFRILSGIADWSWTAGLLIPNQNYALMYRAAATVKGISLVPHVTDIAGRTGIGISACIPAEIQKGSMPGFHGCPDRKELVFDAKTYELVGTATDPAPGHARLPGSPDLALLQIAIVNRSGQLP